MKLLDKIARGYTDNEMTRKMQIARSRLFDKIQQHDSGFQTHIWIRIELSLLLCYKFDV